jgi:NitT/TauT family transport system permease protein
MKSVTNYALPVIFGTIVIAAWHAICTFFRLPDYLIPTPAAVLRVVVYDFGYLLDNSRVTILEAVLGLLMALTFGFVSGVIFANVWSVRKMVLPYFIASQAVPIVAVAPLFILWFGNGLASKVCMAALIGFFPMTVNTSKGLISVDPRQIDLFRINAASQWQIFEKLRLPASVGYVMSGMRVSAALAMIGAIVAEYAGSDRGIGYLIMQATYRLDTPLLFAAILFSVVGGLLIFGAVVFVDRMFFAKYSAAE